MNTMTRRMVTALLTAGIIFCTAPATAAKSSSSKGSAVRSSPRPSTTGPINYRSATPDKTSRLSMSEVRSRSVLERSRTQSSEKLQTVIREKERIGPGWFGTGMLVWLLSQHDLSSSDRRWIQEQINEAKREGEETALPPPPLSDVVFNWSYPPVFRQGETSHITVKATEGVQQKPVTVNCVLKGVHSIMDGVAARLAWTPGTEVSAVMRCEAGGLNDMRMFSVGKT
ncbi:hypothetical protein [Citrobacter amalonaticus]|uniref:hypothetical protein n=1 Tax=Citrobacter amalonaticus TaxID=35703 RepID=UPI0028C2E5C4|nr:hypothetical protein [Citrobacter amalonaticus]MDT7072825.1 hypothetical protein [Citrobacter amalonaticus]HED3078481.1 hypothetical protein [Citrobacter amalonaticus]HED3672078.1 hypothetical protein [Citrobacter amalonaticus]HED3697719.1 hypothetical protein [Citrobacter amalonaticus]